MQDLNNKNILFDLLSKGASVITPNNRLSGALLRQYFEYCNSSTVDKPSCLPYTTAIKWAYQQIKFQTPNLAHPTLLNTSQCQHLWRKIIKGEHYITYSEGLLHSVMEAWGYCNQWQIDPNDPSFQYTPQTRQFQSWWQLFNTQLKQLNAISEHQIIPYWIKSGNSIAARSVIWVCFDDYSPQQLHLQNFLTDLGVTQYHYDLNNPLSSTSLFTAKDSLEEYQQLLAWLDSKLKLGEQRIGVVIPNLQQESRFLKRILLNQFDPSLFDISLGQALSEFPIIAHALSWINLDSRRCSHHQTALTLQSPYIGFAKEEFQARSQYLQDSSLLQDQSIPMNTLIDDLKPHAPKLAEILIQIKPYPQKATPQEWIEVFHERLNTLGFPGDYGLNSENYQCLNRFKTIFDELMQFNLISPQLTAKDAIEALHQLCENTIFQPQKSNAPIQISGLLEASGCEFNSLWVMGLTDQCLPQKIRLSAFIPAQMQRELSMPHSLPERELKFAIQTLSRLQKGSTTCVFSYSRLQGENPNLPCSLIADLPGYEPLALSCDTKHSSPLITVEETYALPIKSGERILGGTALLANQAKCPFKAFAEHRLKAKPSLTTTDGLDSRERGQIIHKVMEILWRNLDSQAELIKLNSNELEQHIDKAIKIALNPLKQLHPDNFPNLVQEVEYTRLKRLVLAYLDWEKQRPAFTIASLEESYSIELAGLELKVRVDRLDHVADKKWVIDYKSSLPTSKPWNEDRPKEPQLLLYALLDEEINTLLLMQLKAGNVICSGLSEEKQTISGITTLKKDENWEQARVNWRVQLTLLADEFQQGHCPPQPAQLSLCQQCDFQNLCRFQPYE